METFLFDMPQFHLVGIVKLTEFLEGHVCSWITLCIVDQARLQLLNLEKGRTQELIEVVAELPDVKDSLEVFCGDADLH